LQIHKLPDLINKFSLRFSALLEEECKPVRTVIESDWKKVSAELNLFEFKDELYNKFKGKFDDLLSRLDGANNFYEAIAMKEESDRLKLRCLDDIHHEVEIRKPKTSVDGGEGGIKGDDKKPEYKVRKTINISIANILHGAKTIESKDDIEKILDEIRNKLVNELNEDTIIKLV
jgi:hypothetical protein